MRTALANVGARVVDSYPFSLGGTPEMAHDLAVDGVECLIGYLGVISPERLAHVLDAGLAFMPVTLAGRFSGDDAVSELRELGLPTGCTVWLDIEGKTVFDTPPHELADKVNAWADAVAAAGFEPGGYIGVPQPLTSEELYRLRVVRYWRGQGSIRDRLGALAEPSCGWCMMQVYPQHMRGGVLVDDDIVQQDYRRRVPTWVIA